MRSFCTSEPARAIYRSITVIAISFSTYSLSSNAIRLFEKEFSELNKLIQQEVVEKAK